jgi:plasmid maintenance system antidote protein VapI
MGIKIVLLELNESDTLERELGISAKLWLRLQTEYDYDLRITKATRIN